MSMSNKKINQIEVKNPTTGAYELVVDLASITAEASDILEGKTYYNQFGEQQTGTLVLDNEVPTELYDLPDVCFYDFKGTLLYSYTREAFEKLGKMPEGKDDYYYDLYFVEWNYTYQEVLQTKGTVVVGGIYNTGSEHITKLYVETEPSDRFVRLNCYFDGTLKINWGDWKTESYESSSTIEITHTYNDDWKYTVTLDLSDVKYMHFGYYSAGDAFANGPITGIAFGDDVPEKTNNFSWDCIFGIPWPDHKIKFIALPNTTRYIEIGYDTYPLEYYAIPKKAYTDLQPISYVTDYSDQDRRSCVSIPLQQLTNFYDYCGIYVSMASPFRHLILCDAKHLEIDFQFDYVTDKTKYFGRTINFAYLTTIPNIDGLDADYLSKLNKYNLTIYVPKHDGECSPNNEKCWKYHTNLCAAAHLMEEV